MLTYQPIGRTHAAGTLGEQETQLITEVLHLYRNGGSLASIKHKLMELRAVRERMPRPNHRA